MLKALVVDDSRAIRGILSRMLKRNGFTVDEAANGVEAMSRLEGEADDFTLLCVDYNMPEMNGIELLQTMQRNTRFQKVRVVMITTETHLESINKAFKAGANEYLMKPFTEDMVLDKLRILGVLPN